MGTDALDELCEVLFKHPRPGPARTRRSIVVASLQTAGVVSGVKPNLRQFCPTSRDMLSPQIRKSKEAEEESGLLIGLER